MLIAGAGGLATQIFTELVEGNQSDVVFWSETETKYLFIKEKFRILQNDNEVADHFRNHSSEFIICVGTANGARELLSQKFISMGGIPCSYISPHANFSPYGTDIGRGTVILSHVIIEPGVKTGLGCLLNKTSNMGHGSILGDYCELAPGVMIMGDVTVGDHCFIGPGAIILPGINIGSESIISAGTVVRKDVPPHSIVASEPARVLRSKTIL